MIYNSFSFIVIYPLVFLLYYAIPSRYPKARNLFLLVLSYLLYIIWCPVHSLVLLGLTIASFVIAKQIEKKTNKRVIILLGGAFLVVPLILFKYYNFFTEIVYDGFNLIGLDYHLPGLNWAIPIGLSFFSLQAISYVCDVYYGKIHTDKDFLSYALYLSFFPSILSGPINRATTMLPQIKSHRVFFDYQKAVEGMRMILWGLFMKVVVADGCGLYVDTVFDSYKSYSGLSCFIASLFYSVQIYGDLGGYSLIAIGVGKTLGYDLMNNFRRPYLATCISEFWTRWHISLSTWLRDYVYIPLGGNRKGKFKTYRNLIATFFVSGLWHGANWTFIFWGLWHAICIILERILNIHGRKYVGAVRLIRIAIVALIVDFTWILFRMPTVSDAFQVIGKILFHTRSLDLFVPSASVTVFALIILLKDILDEIFPHRRFSFFHNKKLFVRWASYLLVMILILLEGVLNTGSFIYANF